MNAGVWVADPALDFQGVGIVQVSRLDGFPIVGVKRLGEDGGYDGFADFGADAGYKVLIHDGCVFW